MELEDGSYPNLLSVTTCVAELEKAFKGCDVFVATGGSRHLQPPTSLLPHATPAFGTPRAIWRVVGAAPTAFLAVASAALPVAGGVSPKDPNRAVRVTPTRSHVPRVGERGMNESLTDECTRACVLTYT